MLGGQKCDIPTICHRNRCIFFSISFHTRSLCSLQYLSRNVWIWFAGDCCNKFKKFLDVVPQSDMSWSLPACPACLWSGSLLDKKNISCQTQSFEPTQCLCVLEYVCYWEAPKLFFGSELNQMPHLKDLFISCFFVWYWSLTFATVWYLWRLSDNTLWRRLKINLMWQQTIYFYPKNKETAWDPWSQLIFQGAPLVHSWSMKTGITSVDTFFICADCFYCFMSVCTLLSHSCQQPLQSGQATWMNINMLVHSNQ